MANIAPRQDPTNELHPFEERNPFRVGLLSMDPRDFASADLDVDRVPVGRIQVASGN